MKKRIFLFLLLLPLAQSIVQAQSQSEKTKERERISTMLREQMVRDDFKDTTMMYAFAFKVKVARESGNGSLLKEIAVNDSSAYKLYKDFDFLKDVRFELFMKDRKEATFIIPVTVFLSYPGKIKGLNYRDVSDNIQKLFFHNSLGIETPTEDYIYLPGIIGRTTTWVDD